MEAGLGDNYIIIIIIIIIIGRNMSNNLVTVAHIDDFKQIRKNLEDELNWSFSLICLLYGK